MKSDPILKECLIFFKIKTLIMHLTRSDVVLIFILHNVFVALADHYLHENEQEQKRLTTKSTFDIENFDSKISESQSREINKDSEQRFISLESKETSDDLDLMDNNKPNQRTYCSKHCGMADECTGGNGGEACKSNGWSRRKRNIRGSKWKDYEDYIEGKSFNEDLRNSQSTLYFGNDYYEDYYGTDDTRIVSGYDPVERPWMVLLLIRYSKTSSGMCGGALLNHMFVVSAAHCYCKKGLLKCRRTLLYGTQAAYVTSRLVHFQLGINDDDIEPLLKTDASAKYERNRYKAQKIIFHPKYKPYAKFPDINLVQANRRIKFESGTVSPICLPYKNFVDIPTSSKFELKAYVAGWGRETSQNRQPEEPVCHTNGLGPSPYSVCSFPFKSEGKKFFSCIKTEPPPSFRHYICNDFFEWAKHKNVSLWIGSHNDSYLIKHFDKYKNQVRRIRCYNPVSTHGWCGTCYDYEGGSIKSNEEGHCKKRGSSIGLYVVNKLEYSRPTASRHWGWCSESCHTKAEFFSNRLKETKVDVLTEKECRILGKQQKANLKYEFCAGNKKAYPKTKVYRRVHDKKNRRFWYQPENDTETNYLSWGKKNRKLDFFIGGTDACQGDSGGPIYVWDNSRAYLLGVVSRGKECALFNHPGIYTRISKFIPWILQTIKTGKCGSS